MKQIKYEINLNKAVRESVEKIVDRGTVEEEWERMLISTAAKLCELLFDKKVDEDGEWLKEARALQHEMGFFLPSLSEAIFGWIREGKTEVIDGIRALGDVQNGMAPVRN